jgi:tetraacyldisaccharide 4'-kinase
VPDYADLPPAPRVARYGDDALAHRAELPRSVAVVVGADRAAAARAAVEGFGATVLLLDDGWEQRGLWFDRLVAVLDPVRPAGNGRLLPAGPLRRPVETLAEASVVALVLEEGNELPGSTVSFLERYAPHAARLLLRRRLVGVAPPGEAKTEVLPLGFRVGILSGVGAPERLAPFLRREGLEIAGHAVFANHAAWSRAALESSAAALRRAGAQVLLMTGKDEARWPEGLMPGLPARVIRTELVPVGPPADPAALLLPARDPAHGGPRLADRKSFV